MRIRIEGTNLPGRACGPYSDIHVGMQRKSPSGQVDGVVAADAEAPVWILDCTVKGSDVLGPHIQGRPGARFIYLNWMGRDDSGSHAMFRRAKLMLDGVPAETWTAALESGQLTGSVHLTDGHGMPRCAAVRPPAIEWSV
ncbi:DUF5990 family protein [Smaragdicoccus niigatensis]|uniref:DUF5990 family protein n=1 Tax=Smaragdicoccus niigatensis TaxID=359359 RepID=UPI000362C3F5|nr:DUF5990 family protein [Smaragdicoccus niigatensis]